MKRSANSRLMHTLRWIGLLAILAAALPLAAPASAAPITPQVTVFVKGYHEEYRLAVDEFMAGQFDNPDSPAYGLVRYNVVTALTADALAGSSALVIDESADMSLTAGEATLTHNFVAGGGRVGLFAYPRYYWDHEGANAAAYQGVADVWGITAVGEPNAEEVQSGHSSAAFPAPEDSVLSFAWPYETAGQTASTFDQLPFSPVTAANVKTVLVSPALANAPVAVANDHGIFVTNSIGDAVQGNDANAAYSQFVVDSIAWLAQARPQQFSIQLYLPLIRR